jgi:enolase
MINLDGTKHKSKLGANAILAVSMAVKKLSAKLKINSFIQNFFNQKKLSITIPANEYY